MPRPSDQNWDSVLARRRFVLSLAATLGFSGVAAAAGGRLDDPLKPTPDIVGQVTPDAGEDIGISFGDSIQRLIAAGALDPEKLRSDRGLPHWVDRLLTGLSTEPIRFSRDTAPYLVDLLWPLGLSTKAAFNEKSPINTLRIPGFASTGGWTVGRERNGYVYFNTVDAIDLTTQQEAMVLDAAMKTFRPCCDNSTFFQDCNHGSALLGLMELAASQGATAARLYQIALVVNSYWFPDEYAKTALYFSRFKSRSRSEVAPEVVLGPNYSSFSGWRKNVNDRLRRANVRLPPTATGSAACGISRLD
ncbi:MAG: hypothetical protein HYX38_11260 [Rhodospirillales bacterium]|nr:hypothetical protein [Rhodospirillales bacterium]